MNAADAFDIGSFDEEDTKGIKVSAISRHFHQRPFMMARTKAMMIMIVM